VKGYPSSGSVNQKGIGVLYKRGDRPIQLTRGGLRDLRHGRPG